jgi:hypothetical protein
MTDRAWTAARRAQQAALIRRVRPWERATGPRTPVGKAVSSKNGMQPGSRRERAKVRAVLRQQAEALSGLLRKLK